MNPSEDFVIAIDSKSFPKYCEALSVLEQIVDCNVVRIESTSPTKYLEQCEELAEKYSLVIPCTRNMFIRDHLRINGVDLIITV